MNRIHWPVTLPKLSTELAEVAAAGTVYVLHFGSFTEPVHYDLKNDLDISALHIATGPPISKGRQNPHPSWASVVAGNVSAPLSSHPTVNVEDVCPTTMVSDEVVAEAKSTIASSGDSMVVRPRGMCNPSGNCFMNAVLQSMVHCTPLFAFLRSVSLDTLDPPRSLLWEFARFAQACELVPVGDRRPVHKQPIRAINSPVPVEASAESGESPLSGGEDAEQLEPVDIKSPPSPVPEFGNLHVAPASDSFDSGLFSRIELLFRDSGDPLGRLGQQDASEFLDFALDVLHETSKDETISQEDDGDWNFVTSQRRLARSRTISTAVSPISKIFGGQLRSVVVRAGGKSSSTVQPFHCLHLDVDGAHIKSVEDALDVHMTPERLEEGATKQLLVEKLPEVLILHLKRFVWSVSKPRKISKHVPFPISLVLPSHLLCQSSGSNLPQYQLFSVVSHVSRDQNTERGHYTCYSRPSLSVVKTSEGAGEPVNPNDLWVFFNDTKVQIVNKVESVLQAQAYLLFYRRH